MNKNELEKLFPGEFEPTPEYQPAYWHDGHTADKPCASCLHAWFTIVNVAMDGD